MFLEKTLLFMQYFLEMEMKHSISFLELKKRVWLFTFFNQILHLCYITLETKNSLSITYRFKYVL